MVGVLTGAAQLVLRPVPPFNFDATFFKPSHFPSGDVAYARGRYWITMVWLDRVLGLRFESQGTNDEPQIRLSVYGDGPLSPEFVEYLIPEIRWRFNMDGDISEFMGRFREDRVLGPLLARWGGMVPVAANSLFETLMIYFVLQNATVRRSVQMLENLFGCLGRRVQFDGLELSHFWTPARIQAVSEEQLRALKVGYRAKFFKRVAEQFARREIDEMALRCRSCDELRTAALSIYGIGPASVEYLLFEDFYCYDALAVIPPWEQKVLSRHLFAQELAPVPEILGFFEPYRPYRKLAFHYIWEDLFWQWRAGQVPWLESLIRL
jgi:3-methyladenine DNA glycosylase/8-oxoguanine DNA glycosylase